MERLITYGISQQRLEHITKVPNGLACNCVCTHCGQPLVARNRWDNEKQPHFAHAAGTSCGGACESTLHRLAKEVFQQHKTLAIPPFHFDYNRQNPRSLFRKGQTVTFEEVRLEQTFSSGDCCLVADAVGILHGREVLVEFAVTHFVDRAKRSRLKQLRKACIEVNLQGLPLDEALLKAVLESPGPSSYWVYNPKLRKEYMEERRMADV